MDDLEALEELNRLLDAASSDQEAVSAPLHLPAPLLAAVELSVAHFGAAVSASEMTAGALRHYLEAFAQETALRLHFIEHPAAQPSLAEVALALAAQDGSPLAAHPDLLATAATAVAAHRVDADADDVLLWATAHLAAAT